MTVFSYRFRSVLNSGYRFRSVLTSGFFIRSLKDYTISLEFPKAASVSRENGQSKGGVAILLGWTGSRIQSLDKYGQLYLDRQQTVLKVCPSTVLILKFGSPKVVRRLTEEVYATLHANNLEKQPLLFHVFSNGGSMLYSALVANWLNRKRIPFISGTIFDSGPARISVMGIHKAISEAVPGSDVFKNGVAAMGVLWAYSSLYRNYVTDWILRGDISQTDIYRFHFYETLLSLPNLGPEFCLFSKCDSLIDYRDVEGYIGRRKMTGVEVEYRMWDDSTHVKHFLTHPTEYANAVNSFINSCKKKLAEKS